MAGVSTQSLTGMKLRCYLRLQSHLGSWSYSRITDMNQSRIYFTEVADGGPIFLPADG